MKKLLLSVSTLLLLGSVAMAAEGDTTQLEQKLRTQDKLQTQEKLRDGSGDGKQIQNQYQHQDQYQGVPPKGAKNSYKQGIDNGAGYVGGEGTGTKGPNAKNTSKSQSFKQGGSSMGGGNGGGGGGKR